MYGEYKNKEREMEGEKLLLELLAYPHETEWLEFKTNYWNENEIGIYISALSNAAAMCGKKEAYLIWGIDDSSHEIVGTNIDYRADYKHEPFEHYIARNLTPSIHFQFSEFFVANKRVVILTIPAALKVPTEFQNERYIRIGSAKESLRKYPQRESALWKTLIYGSPTLTNTDSEKQELTFNKLLLYYASKNKQINRETFEENLELRNRETGKYNLLALLLSDENAISVRVSIFNGKTKSSGLRSVKEFGNTCILYSLDNVVHYALDVLNVPITDERNRVLERNEIFLFDSASFREAIINAFVHNNWQRLNAPQVSVYSDRIEILSHGTIGSDQTMNGFFKGISRPVNPSLARILMQLEISDRAGKGVPTIIDRYGKRSFLFEESSITVIIPFEDIIDSNPNNKKKIVYDLSDNPTLTVSELAERNNLSNAMATKIIRELKEDGVITRKGSKKKGYWKVEED